MKGSTPNGSSKGYTVHQRFIVSMSGACLLFAIKGQLDELEADTAANKKELDAYRRIDWIGTIPELRAFFEFLVDNHLIRVKNDFCVMLQDTCLHDGDKIPISTLDQQ